jgi:hypothetical protein
MVRNAACFATWRSMSTSSKYGARSVGQNLAVEKLGGGNDRRSAA